MKRTRRNIKRIIRHFGYEIQSVEQSKKRCPSLSTHIAALFDKYAIECVLDVGACIGEYRDFLRDRLGFAGLVVSFEPVKRDAELLKLRARNDKNWIVYDVALGDENTTKEINVTNEGGFSSFLDPDHSVVSKFTEVNVVDHKESVQVRTLDAVMELLNDRLSLRHTFLKMDTQGWDLRVVEGAQNTLPFLPALQTEVSLLPIYRSMPGLLDTYINLKAKGFDITGMFPIHRDSLLRIIEFDCVMVNSRQTAA